MREFKSQFGFLTIAQNNDITDYLELAYQQALNVKATQKQNQFAVLVDADTAKFITDQHREIFDYIIEFPTDYAKNEQWKMSDEWQVFYLTPFKETIKLESDLLFTRDITHWLDGLRFRDICFSLHCKNLQSENITSSPYRKIFKENDLPDIYTGMYYFRYSQTSADFFRTVRDVYTGWDTVKNHLALINEPPTTDLAFAVAAKIIGADVCTIPTLDFFNFVHLKPQIQGWNETQAVTDHVNVEWQDNIVRINNRNQYYPVHYYEKGFVHATR